VQASSAELAGRERCRRQGPKRLEEKGTVKVLPTKPHKAEGCRLLKWCLQSPTPAWHRQVLRRVLQDPTVSRQLLPEAP